MDVDVISFPLHKMNLKSNLISGPVIVGVKPEFPVKGVSMLLGNDLTGCKVLPEPIVTREPCTKADNVENNVVFPACAISRSMTRKGDDLGPNLDLKGSFMTKLHEPGHSPSSVEKKSPK